MTQGERRRRRPVALAAAAVLVAAAAAGWLLRPDPPRSPRLPVRAPAAYASEGVALGLPRAIRLNAERGGPRGWLCAAPGCRDVTFYDAALTEPDAAAAVLRALRDAGFGDVASVGDCPPPERVWPEHDLRTCSRYVTAFRGNVVSTVWVGTRRDGRTALEVVMARLRGPGPRRET